MQIIILSVTCMGIVVSIDAMYNPEEPKYAPGPLPPEHFENVKGGCVISIKVKNNNFEERGLIYHMSPSDWTHWGYAETPIDAGVESVHMNVFDIGLPGYDREANTFWGARVAPFENRKKRVNRKNEVTLECGNWHYPVELHYQDVSYEQLPSTVRVRARKGDGYTILTGTLSLAPKWVPLPRRF